MNTRRLAEINRSLGRFRVRRGAFFGARGVWGTFCIVSCTGVLGSSSTDAVPTSCDDKRKQRTREKQKKVAKRKYETRSVRYFLLLGIHGQLPFLLVSFFVFFFLIHAGRERNAFLDANEKRFLRLSSFRNELVSTRSFFFFSKRRTPSKARVGLLSCSSESHGSGVVLRNASFEGETSAEEANVPCSSRTIFPSASLLVPLLELRNLIVRKCSSVPCARCEHAFVSLSLSLSCSCFFLFLYPSPELHGFFSHHPRNPWRERTKE